MTRTKESVAVEVQRILEKLRHVSETQDAMELMRCSLENDLQIDSLDRIAVVADCESVFDIEIPDGEMNALKTVQGLVDVCCRYLGIEEQTDMNQADDTAGLLGLDAAHDS